MFSSQRNLVFLGLIIVGVFLLLALFSNSDSFSNKPVFGDLTLKDGKPQQRQYDSNYDRFKKDNDAPSNLRYTVQQQKENPLFSIYKQDQIAAEEASEAAEMSSKGTKSIRASGATKSSKGAKRVRKRQSEFFNFTNDDFLDASVFSAVFKEGQWVRPGKALRLILEEPIKAINLRAGTVLKGIPTLEGGRIQVRITAGELGSVVRRLNLVCLDRDDCVPGLYNDVLAARHQKDMQNGLLEEVFSLIQPSKTTNDEETPAKDKLLSGGGRIVSKVMNNWKTDEEIFIKSGREVLIIIPEDLKNN